jgi:hypothetical protein
MADSWRRLRLIGVSVTRYAPLRTPVAFPMENVTSSCGKPNDDPLERDGMKQKMDVRQGPLALMFLKTLDVLGPVSAGFAMRARA